MLTMQGIDTIRFGLLLLIFCIIPALLYVGFAYGRDKHIFWRVIFIGVASPWIVGILVKLYLQMAGKPTLPWSYFLNFYSLLLLVLLAIWFSLPFIMLAIIYRSKIAAGRFLGIVSYKGRFIMTMCILAGGIVGVCLTFTFVFWEFDFMFFLAPLWIAYLPGMFIGFIIGLFTGRIIDVRQKRESIYETTI